MKQVSEANERYDLIICDSSNERSSTKENNFADDLLSSRPPTPSKAGQMKTEMAILRRWAQIKLTNDGINNEN